LIVLASRVIGVSSLDIRMIFLGWSGTNK
jgi:hypothetical protein